MRRGWQVRKIGDVCDLATGGTPSRSRPEYFGGDIKWLVSGDIHQGEICDCEGRITEKGMKSSNAKLLPLNSVMIALNGQGKTRGTVAILRTQATCNQSLVSMSPRQSSGLLPEFLFANLHGRYQEIRRLTGDDDKDRRGLNMGLISNIEVPIAPLPEQKRIIAILDEAFDGLATAKTNAEKNLQNARALFESHLHSIFGGRGKGWVERPLETVSAILNGYAFKSTDFSPKGSVKCIKITNVGVREFVCESDAFLPANFRHEFRALTVKRGSIVIALTRTIIADGLKVAVVPDEYDGALLNQRVAAIQTKEQILGREFLFAYLSTQAVAEYVRERVNTLMQPNLSINDLRAMPVPVPPRGEQEKITVELNELRSETKRLKSICQQKLDALQELNKSILHKAFAGNL